MKLRSGKQCSVYRDTTNHCYYNNCIIMLRFLISCTIVNLSVSDDNHKSKQPFHKVVSAACRNALSKKRYILLVTIIVLFLVILVVILAYSQNLMLF